MNIHVSFRAANAHQQDNWAWGDATVTNVERPIETIDDLEELRNRIKPVVMQQTGLPKTCTIVIIAWHEFGS